MTGSFRPIEFGDWAREAYVDRDEAVHEDRHHRIVVVDNSDSDGDSDGEGGSEYADSEFPAQLRHD